MNNEKSNLTVSSESGVNEKVVKKSDLESLKQTEELHTVVRVEDEALRPYILLEDCNGERFWNTLNGDKEFTIKSNEWFKQGQKLFDDKKLDPHDADVLKECILSISVLSNFFEWDEETVGKMMDQLIIKFAHVLYCKNTGKNTELKDLESNEEYFAYLNLSAIMCKAFTSLHDEIAASVEQAKQEQKTVDKAV